LSEGRYTAAYQRPVPAGHRAQHGRAGEGVLFAERATIAPKTCSPARRAGRGPGKTGGNASSLIKLAHLPGEPAGVEYSIPLNSYRFFKKACDKMLSRAYISIDTEALGGACVRRPGPSALHVAGFCHNGPQMPFPAPRLSGHARAVPQLKPLAGFALRARCPGRRSARTGTVCRAEVAARRQNPLAEKDLRREKSAQKSFLSKTVSRTKPPKECERRDAKGMSKAKSRMSNDETFDI
jgi:hypothetical protein